MLWVEKYRPKKIKECILPQSMSETFQKFVDNGEIPNLLLTGTQGSGKTSVAKALALELDAEVLFIDASSDSGKSVIIDKVAGFAGTVSVGSSAKQKIIIFDEADGITFQAQQALRPNIELYSENCRFIFTANYDKKIIPAIKSRCVHIDFSLTKEDKPELINKFCGRAAAILKNNNIEYEKSALKEFVTKLFPDYRKIINELYAYSQYSGKIDDGILKYTTDDTAEDLYDIIINKKFAEAKIFAYENTNTSEDIINSLFLNLEKCVPINLQPGYIVTLAEYQYKSSFVANQQLNLLAMITELMGNS